MKKQLGLILIIAFSSIFFACTPSEAQIQAAIEQTEAAKPTETETPKPTETPTNTPLPSPTFTPIPTDTPEPLPLEERIIGKWSGMMTNANNDKLPATWTFITGGIMLVEIGEYSYGAEWSIEGNRIIIVSELDPANPTYRDAEFINDDLMILTKEEFGIKETWSRVK